MPPLHTPYNPPYLPDVLQAGMTPVQETRLYSVNATSPSVAPDGPARLTPLEPPRLAGDLRPLLVAALDTGGLFPPPDEVEAAFVLAWWGVWPLHGWLAEMEHEGAWTPVGFVLLQPDLAAPVAWAKGGRSWLRRPWLSWRSRRPATVGRLLAGGVLPEWRGQGIGIQLWRQVLAHAMDAGWRELTAGPLDPESAGASFLTARGATAQQRYLLYASEG
jgi:GNAT superfamily N-acetyltransferase